jgi:hypothetical protein
MVSFLAEAEEDIPGGKPRKKNSADDDEDWVETHSGRGMFGYVVQIATPSLLLTVIVTTSRYHSEQREPLKHPSRYP